MTKRRDAIRKISDEAKRQGIDWVLDREVGPHSIFSLDGLMIPIPRHNELGNRFAETLYKECESKLG